MHKFSALSRVQLSRKPGLLSDLFRLKSGSCDRNLGNVAGKYRDKRRLTEMRFHLILLALYQRASRISSDLGVMAWSKFECIGENHTCTSVVLERPRIPNPNPILDYGFWWGCWLFSCSALQWHVGDCSTGWTKVGTSFLASGLSSRLQVFDFF